MNLRIVSVLCLAMALALASPAAAQQARGRTKAPSRVDGAAKKVRTKARLRPAERRRAKTESSRPGLRRGAEGKVRVLRPGTGAKSWSPALGRLGPLGALGPLGRYGPVGDNVWNPSTLFRVVGDWSSFQKKLTGAGGPLGGLGPLGPEGPLGRSYRDFPAELRAGGDLAALGPDGPLGPLGALGPLGPVGAHGYGVDKSGNYVKDGKVERTIEVPYRDGARSYELFEKYPADYAARKRDNDTSFMAVGRLAKSRKQYTFPLRSRHEQNVNMVVTSELVGDRFQLEVLDAKDRVLGRASSEGGPAFLQLSVPKGARLRARVSLPPEARSGRSHPFRLYVVGSTPYNSAAGP